MTMSEMTQNKIAQYRGSQKHKNRPANGRKGTRCPEWTHIAGAEGYGNDPFKHDWETTLAQRLLAESELDPEGSGKRYATANGIAFVGQETGDGTWHGYPEPWNRIPVDLKDLWLDQGKVSRKDLRRYSDFPAQNINWALEIDNE